MITRKNDQCGKKLASGTGLNKLFDVSKRLHLDMENSILVVAHPEDIRAKWILYEKVK